MFLWYYDILCSTHLYSHSYPQRVPNHGNLSVRSYCLSDSFYGVELHVLNTIEKPKLLI